MDHESRWTRQKIARRIALIEPLAYRRRTPLPAFRFRRLSDPGTAPILGPDADRSDWQGIEAGDYWGAHGIDFMLSSRFSVPQDWPEDAPVALYLPLGESGSFSHPEALAYVDGRPHAGCDRHHQELALDARWRDGRTHHLDLHGYAGGATSKPALILQMGACAVVQIDPPTRAFLATARVALGVAECLDPNHPARDRLLNALDAAFRLADLREPFADGFYASIPQAQRALAEGVEAAGPPLDVRVVAAGHAHIDVAWLWTLDQTRNKAARTFHTVLRLMEQFPDYRFTQSQPQLYEMVRQDHPELFEAIRSRVAEGRWEAIGGMWVEADCNLSGGEALVRQLMLGRGYFREHFGPERESPVLWLPDVFGYAWNLPQLIKEAGLEYFFTIKIGWNQYNRLPYDSFWWQGLDGTRVLTHFSTTPDPERSYASTYNARATPDQVIGTWSNLQQKAQQRELLMAYGWGDGGGGPTREMLENIATMRRFPATPQVRCGTAGEFFRRLEAEAGDRLPIWNGELYLELHRGTYTSQARSKRANRKFELLLHDAEFLATMASVMDPGYRYPAETLRAAWELVCLNQFHDILPGSSVGAVYAESIRQYERVREIGEAARDGALGVIAASAGGDDRLLAINPTGFARRDLALWTGHLADGESLRRAGGPAPAATQTTGEGTLIDAGELAPYSVTPLERVSRGPAATGTVTATPRCLENRHLRVELDAAGDITRIYDKIERREVLVAGAPGNQFQAFEDRPLDWDAWDIDAFYEDKRYLAEPASEVRVAERGPLRGAIEIRRRILGSPYTQRVSLAHDSARLDFDTRIDWRERHVLLKVAFPVQVLSPVATYEVQWGNVERPTHRNTSWDWARFETCAHKWVDLSEGGYGVSLLNDGKYGHDVHGQVMRLTLLRSPTEPDPEADQGEHRFCYALLPHPGRWDERTPREAYALNDPILVAATSDARPRSSRGAPGRLAEGAPLVSVDRPNVVIETVKRAEDGDGIVVRLYESQRRRGPVVVRTGFDLAGAERVDLLEARKANLEAARREVSIKVLPYQIVSLRLRPA